jgi:DNA-binding transcriptional regulator YiaG
MPPDQIRALRGSLALTQAQFATLLGFAGKEMSRAVIVSSYECGRRRPSPPVQRLLLMIAAHGPAALTRSLSNA